MYGKEEVVKTVEGFDIRRYQYSEESNVEYGVGERRLGVITVYVPHKRLLRDELNPAEVNWSSIGAVSPKFLVAWIEALKLAMTEAALMNLRAGLTNGG